MKKISILINCAIAFSFLLLFFRFVSDCMGANTYFTYVSSHPNDYDYNLNSMLDAAVRCTIYAIIEAVLIVSLGASLFFFNYRFDGVSLREKIATRLLESKEKRAQYRVEKAAADKKAAIEDKQKRLEELQAEEEDEKTSVKNRRTSRIRQEKKRM